MKHQITTLFLIAGTIIYVNTAGSNSIISTILTSICLCIFVLLKRSEKKLSKYIVNRAEILNLINAIPMPAFLKDLNGHIFIANKEFFEFFKIPDKTDYKTISKIVYSKFDPMLSLEEDKRLKADDTYIDTERVIRTDTNIKKYYLYKAGIYNKKNVLTNIAVFIKGTEIDSDKCKNEDMIATITHDLKTPAVAQIRGIELLLNGYFGEINDKQRSFLNDILQSGNYMLSMLIDMLWLYKFDNKKINLNITSFDINELIRDVLKENKLILNIKHSKFVQNNKTARIHILADKSHIKRIINNILINAVMHSDEKSEIYIDTTIEGCEFFLKIKNKGKPINKDLMKCILDRNGIFNQKSGGLSTGLGLYLSNSLLELNGGQFICESTPEGYNTFGFSVKLHNNPAKMQASMDLKSKI